MVDDSRIIAGLGPEVKSFMGQKTLTQGYPCAILTSMDTDKPTIELIWKGKTKPEDRTEEDYSYMSRVIDTALEQPEVMEEIGDVSNIKKIIYVERKLVNFVTG